MVATTTALVDGAVGGLLATSVMTAAMLAFDDGAPPTASLWARFLGEGSPDGYVLQGLALHGLYGLVAGGIFGAVAVTLGFDVTTDLLAGLGGGVVWSVVLFVVAATFWLNVVVRVDDDPDDRFRFFLLHLVYGTVLGAWTGVGVLDAALASVP